MLLEDLQVILKVAEFRSITAAATHLNMRTATASAAVKRVEATLGVELFIRTTRHLRLSSAGERYIPQCEQALLMLEQANQKIKDDLDIVDGELRISISSDLGRNVVIPWLDEFMTTYPGVSLSVNLSDSKIDFYRDSVDIAIRYGSPSDASLYGFKICNVPRLLCASPDYIKNHEMPAHPHDLVGHNGLFYQLYDITHDVWEFSKGETPFKIKMNGNRASNDGDVVRRWCVAGKGLAVKSSLDMAEDLFAGRVKNIMTGYEARPTELWLIFPGRQLITPAARLLRDMLKEKTRTILLKLIDKGLVETTTLD